ncbi:TonB-dependent receptor [Gaoshiqia sediminis]|uniref:TonB-dependent receptor n=1 Tax=Gaoshiqia sediminis TaxID=2986998 RepID=A0AA41YA75_9BACT|nr:TonB-dependent receptor [Gaoshiqia sediminis]MCW0484511.1 TonB-dependent receptor [Gaoshiqia sediminis]
MKLTILLLCVTFLSSLASQSYSQSTKLTVVVNNATVENVLRDIENQSEYRFLYNGKIDVDTRVSVNFVNKNIFEILDNVFEESPITYEVIGRQIVLSEGENTLNSQQVKTITGVVTGVNGDPIPGVSVVVKGTTQGTITDIEGKFSLKNVNADQVLLFSFVGMESTEILIGSESSFNVVLEESTVGIEEVVAIGYGTVKKSDLTGSVSSLRKDDLNKGVTQTVAGLLQGKAAGVQITQASNEPGGGTTVQIRGAGSVNAGAGPLYVIDGLPIENSQVIDGNGTTIPGVRVPRSPMANINPADIESIEILKDASATAIYGARGANGVILVTTKKGSSGALRINYSGYTGLQTPKDMIEVLKADDYMRILNEILDTPGSNVSEAERVTEIQNGGTDWQDELLRNAIIHSHSLSFTGGNDKTKYFASLNYFNQDGVLITSGYERYDSRFNLEHKSDNMTVGINFSTSYTHDNVVPVGFSTNEEGSSLYAARGYDPSLSIFDEDGNYQVVSWMNLDNPLALVYGKTSETDNYRTLGTIFGEYTLLKGWTAKLNIGFDSRNSRRDTYVSRLTKDGRANSGIGTVLTGTRNNYLGEFTTTYHRDLENKSSFTVMGGITYQKFININFSGTGKGFPVDESKTDNMSLANASLYTMDSSKNNNKLLSYIGRANYNLFDKFLFTATLRVDGSSRFGENSKYGYFPSGAFAWKMHEHDFIKNLNIFNSLKFRASVGRTGNQNIGNFLSITTFNQGANVILGGEQYVTLAPTRIANPDLKWETTEQINIGFDMGFLENRIMVSTDYFQKNTFDMLFALPIPASTGYTSIMSNIGNIKNSGFEFTIDSRNLTGKFKWNTNLNFSTLKNRVTDTGDITEIIHTGAGQSTSQIAIIRKGETLDSFYGYKTDGIWQSQEEITASGTKDPVKPGDVKFVDQNGDDVVNTNDRVILGKSFPSFTMGMTNVFEYKNFQLNVFIDAATGVDMLNNSKVETYYPVSHRRNRMAEPYLNRWTETNPSNKWPSFVNPAGQGNKAVSDLTVEDASYIRLQTAQLSYQVPLKSKRIFDRVSVYVSGQNLYTITNYTGQDPTTNSNGNSSLKIDFNSYPVYRTYTFGVELGF